MALLDGGYRRVCGVTLAAHTSAAPYDVDYPLGANARRLYRIEREGS